MSYVQGNCSQIWCCNRIRGQEPSVTCDIQHDESWYRMGRDGWTSLGTPMWKYKDQVPAWRFILSRSTSKSWQPGHNTHASGNSRYPVGDFPLVFVSLARHQMKKSSCFVKSVPLNVGLVLSVCIQQKHTGPQKEQ